jgi:hypothetical protein
MRKNFNAARTLGDVVEKVYKPRVIKSAYWIMGLIYGTVETSSDMK